MQRPLIIATLLLCARPLPALELLEEVIVTAELRETPLLSQPASTSVLTATEIEQRAARHLEDILNLAPNVNYASGASRARFFQIRGIGERSQFVDPQNPSIGFVMDGIDFSGLATAATTFDIQQVEILRGPQGTLHGANALAGLISVSSAAPEEEHGLQVEASYAEYDSWSLGAAATGPLVRDSLLYRLSLYRHTSDGYMDNDFLGRDDTNNHRETSVRGKLRWLLSPAHTLDITALYADIDNGYDAFSLDNTRHTLSDQPGQDAQETSAIAVNWYGELQAFDLQALFTGANSDTDYGYDEDWSFVGIAPGWEYSSVDQYLRQRDSYSAQLRFLSNDKSSLFGGASQWVGGIYYLGNREDLRRRYTYLTEDFLSTYDTDTLALFGQLDTSLDERWSLLAGLRYEHRETDYSDSNGAAGDPDSDLWGGRLTLQYQWDERRMGYATLSRGYRADGVNSSILSRVASASNPTSGEVLETLTTFEEEYLTNLELGIKGSFFGDSLTLRCALFYMEREDQQVKGSLVLVRDDGSPDFVDYINNAAEGDNYGLELELNWLAGERLNLYANIGLLEAGFDEYIAPDGTDQAGRDQAHAPTYQFALGGRFDFGRGFYLRLDVEGKDDFYFSDRHDARSEAYNLLHMRLGYTAANWSVALWGRNLADEDYYVRGFGSFGNDPRKEYMVEPYYQYGQPRVIGISASYDF